jgi:hypothetical protein
VRVQVVADRGDRGPVDQHRAAVARAAEPAEQVGEVGGYVSASEVADRPIDVVEHRGDVPGCRGRVLHRIGDERQCVITQRIADQLGADVDDAVTEAHARRRGAVVDFVRMQDVQLPR